MFYQVMYSSKAAKEMTMADLESILDEARSNNETQDITGVLVFVDGVFIQVLEGDKQQVLNLISKIESDSRHNSMTKFYQEAVDERAFSSWRMAYLNASCEQVAVWSGIDGSASLSQILDSINSGTANTAGYIKYILGALSTADA